MKCPVCDEDLGPPVGFDIYPLDDNEDGTPGGVHEEDQYHCDKCNRLVFHMRDLDKNGAREEIVAGRTNKEMEEDHGTPDQ
jgi:hypothetical protein